MVQVAMGLGEMNAFLSMFLCDARLANLNRLYLAANTTHVDTHLLWLGLVAVVTGQLFLQNFTGKEVEPLMRGVL